MWFCSRQHVSAVQCCDTLSVCFHVSRLLWCWFVSQITLGGGCAGEWSAMAQPSLPLWPARLLKFCLGFVLVAATVPLAGIQGCATAPAPLGLRTSGGCCESGCCCRSCCRCRSCRVGMALLLCWVVPCCVVCLQHSGAFLHHSAVRLGCCYLCLASVWSGALLLQMCQHLRGLSKCDDPG